MRLHKDDGSDEPCRHMEGMLNRVADGSAGNATRRLVLAHVFRCDRCRRFLESLKEMLAQLRNARASEPNASARERILDLYRHEIGSSEDSHSPPP